MKFYFLGKCLTVYENMLNSIKFCQEEFLKSIVEYGIEG